MPSRSWSTISSRRSRDLLVDAAEVVAVELLAAALAQPLEHLAQALHVAALAVLEALLHHSPQGGVQVAVVEEVVGHLLEQRVGVEIEPDLRAVPPGVLEPAHLPLYASTAPGRRANRTSRPGRSVVRADRIAGVSLDSLRLLVGYGCVVDTGRRRGARVRLVRDGAGGADAAVG